MLFALFLYFSLSVIIYYLKRRVFSINRKIPLIRFLSEGEKRLFFYHFGGFDKIYLFVLNLSKAAATFPCITTERSSIIL